MNPGELTLVTSTSARDFEMTSPKLHVKPLACRIYQKYKNFMNTQKHGAIYTGSLGEFLALFGYEKTSFIKVIYLEY
ncbi:hypothetical protein SPHINGO8BC_51102 [Sphingobacterium multivorum]|uniref:Uncharacterized protein n=1 Tax=Sphingobacterium multivorum TaxID=28454 RepID=A0A654CST0_SPHMU|nr:hypothetical protein SPHINGO8BC_51102 [Sphingobacterium multivorum]